MVRRYSSCVEEFSRVALLMLMLNAQCSMLNAQCSMLNAHAITFDCKTFVPAAQHHNTPIYSNSMVVEQSIRVQHVMNWAFDFVIASALSTSAVLVSHWAATVIVQLHHCLLFKCQVMAQKPVAVACATVFVMSTSPWLEDIRIYVDSLGGHPELLRARSSTFN
eukprot:scaffold9614_cov91-Skeletonema_dohrnii-CCMP3373.AAC.6